MDVQVTSRPYRSPNASVLTFNEKSPQIDDSVFIADGARIIGDVRIARNCSVWFNTVLRGDVHTIEIGEHTNIQDGVVIHGTEGKHRVKIGAHVTIGHLAVVHGCEVGEGCLVGMQAVILDGAKVGEHSIIGAGAVVTQGTVIPPRSLVLGAPAKVTRTLSEEQIVTLREHAIKYYRSAREYDERIVS